MHMETDDNLKCCNCSKMVTRKRSQGVHIPFKVFKQNPWDLSCMSDRNARKAEVVEDAFEEDTDFNLCPRC